MSDFNPANAQVRHAWETVAGIATETGWHDGEIVSEEATMEYGTIQPESITTSAQRVLALPSKINGSGTIPIEWDAESYARCIANLQKNTATPTNPAASTYVHKLAPSESDVAFANTMSFEIWRDDDQGHLFTGSRVNELVWELAPEGLFTGSVGFAPERGGYFTGPTQKTGTSTNVEVRGIPAYVYWEGVPRFLWIEVTLITGFPNTIDLVATLDASGTVPPTHGGTDFTCNIGLDSQGRPQWNSVVLSDASGRLGTRDLEVEVYISTGDQSLLDEWVYGLDRPVWTPTYPTLPKFNEIFAKILIGDTFATAEEYEIDQFSLTATRPAEPKHAIGGRFPKRVKERGQREISGSLQREYLDTALRRRLERAQSFWLYVQAYSGEEIDPGYEHSMELISGACVLGGSTPTVGGQDTMDESYDFTCHPSGDATYPDDLTVVLTNTLTVLNT
jgi:hypothetical protein